MQVTQDELLQMISPVIAGKRYDLPRSFLPYLERQRRRLAFRNEKTLYKRECDLSGRPIIGTYAPDAPFKVYGQNEFFSDKWNAKDYGRDYDFSRGFFEQFAELMKIVPRLCIVNKQCENSEYCNYSFANKNCYLLFGAHYEEDCMYGRYSTKNKDCLDYFWCYGSELCYENQFSANCYKSAGLDHCENCDNCWFSMDLKSCKNCIFSYGLRNKQYCVFNEQKTEDEYNDYFKKLQLDSAKQWKKVLKGWNDYKKNKAVFRAQYQTNCENCEGTEHQNSKNLVNSYACSDCEDCINAFQHDQTVLSMDCSHTGYDKCEFCYESIGINGAYHNICCDSCWHSSDLLYCNLCFSSKNCFGCIGLQQSEYCIFNKQYTREEYEQLVPKIIMAMGAAKEWGEFFPTSIAPFAYNETVAQEFCPLGKEQVLAKGWDWRDEEGLGEPGSVEIPDRIEDCGDDVCHKVLYCEVTGKPYKIMPLELNFYRTLGVPVPTRCPDQRMLDRVDMSGFLKMYDRKCAKTGKPIKTIYGVDRATLVYSEDAYLKEIY